MVCRHRDRQKISHLTLWCRAVRPFAYPASVIPVLLGTLLAYHDGSFNFLHAFLTLAGVLLLHTGTNLVNDYYDFCNGVDTADSHGSSGVLVNGLLKPRQIYRAAMASFVMALPIGFYLALVSGLPVLFLGMAGFLGGYFYTAGPVAYKYRGLGVFFVFVLMGPLTVLGAYYVQARGFNPSVLAVSLPVGFLVAAVLYANEYRDAAHDSLHRINNLSIILGRARAPLVYYALLSGAYLTVIYLAVRALITPCSLLILATLPLAVRLAVIMETSARGEDPPQLLLLDALTARLHLQFGLLLAAGITLGLYF